LGWGWFATHVLWSVVGGLTLGAVVGTGFGRYVQFLRRRNIESVALEDFLALGLLAVTYGIAIEIGVYGFLAAFALGSGLRRTETRFVTFAHSAGVPRPSGEAERRGEGHPGGNEELPGLAGTTLRMTEQLERLFEFGVVLLLGGMLSKRHLTANGWWFVPLLFLVIRPVAVSIGLLGTAATRAQRTLVCWFGIRGIGSLYYLAYAVAHGLSSDTAHTLAGVTLTTVAASVAVHGVSVTPLLRQYDLIGERRRRSEHPAIAKTLLPGRTSSD
jgi:NhaP-type Na+/H+ or K+/H+ antiporter